MGFKLRLTRDLEMVVTKFNIFITKSSTKIGDVGKLVEERWKGPAFDPQVSTDCEMCSLARYILPIIVVNIQDGLAPSRHN